MLGDRIKFHLGKKRIRKLGIQEIKLQVVNESRIDILNEYYNNETD